ncbi:hypothetical protein TNCV_4192221 [Trichonephila clavipes]|nr:hypothetical protein TNCV_4192221 [Trichonephila clavipes]
MGADSLRYSGVYQALILSRLDYELRLLPACMVCHQPPLDLRRRQLSANYFIRAMSVPSHPLKPFALAIGLNRLYEGPFI